MPKRLPCLEQVSEEITNVKQLDQVNPMVLRKTKELKNVLLREEIHNNRNGT